VTEGNPLGHKGRRRDNAEGITITEDDLTATLDGEHLDKEAHPYDLLNTHLAPGVRKLPSELDVEIIQALLDRGEE
jgi:hypothetical protein